MSIMTAVSPRISLNGLAGLFGRVFPVLFPFTIYTFAMVFDRMTLGQMTSADVATLLALSAATGLGALWVESRMDDSILLKLIWIVAFVAMFFAIPAAGVMLLLAVMGKVAFLPFVASLVLMTVAFRAVKF